MTKVSNLETEMDDDMKEIALQDWVSFAFFSEYVLDV